MCAFVIKDDSNVEKIPFLEFVPNNWRYLGEAPKIIFVAQSNSGKTVAMDYLLSLMTNLVDAVVVMSKTETVTGKWGRRVDRLFIHHEFKPQVIRRIIDENKLQGRSAPKIMIILDDVLSDQAAMKHPVVLELFAEARNYGIGVMITTQYLKWIPTGLRNNVQAWIFMRDFGERSRKAIWTECANSIRPFAKFEEVFSKCTANYKAFVVLKTYAGEDPLGMYHWWAPKELPDKCTCFPPLVTGRCSQCGAYKIGSSDARTFSKKHFDAEARALPTSASSSGPSKRPKYEIVLKKAGD